jgi:hypothetical protein
MAFVDARVNYKIMDKLLERWSELGFDKDVDIKYSSPTIFYQNLVEQNEELVKMKEQAKKAKERKEKA